MWIFVCVCVCVVVGEQARSSVAAPHLLPTLQGYLQEGAVVR